MEPAQIFINVGFVTTSNRDVLSYGIDIGSGGWNAGLGLGQIPTRLPFNLGAGGFDDKLIANDAGVGPFADNTQNPSGATTIPNVIFGALNLTEVTAAMRLLEKTPLLGAVLVSACHTDLGDAGERACAPHTANLPTLPT